VSWKVVVWVLRNWLRAVMFSGGLEGGYVGAPTAASVNCLVFISSKATSPLL